MLIKKRQRMGLFVTVIMAFMLVTGFIAAQEFPATPADRSPTAIHAGSSYIPVQGRLTDAAGNPLNGTYSVTFRLYDVVTGGTPLCEKSRDLSITDGLFNTYISGTDCSIDGRALYLGVQVASDPEMTPRAYIDNVPYAWSLRPGAEIKGSSNDSILLAQNEGFGSALSGKSLNPATDSVGVEGTSTAGIGVQGDSFSGVAIKATGTGIIQSTAKSYVWISGNGVRPYYQSDSTVIDMTNTGGARIYRGATSGNKNVMLPITVPGQLYGQNVTVSDLDIYWAGNTDFDAITAVLLRRQTGVCATSACYETILLDTNDYVCDIANNSTGCVKHYDLTTNNILSQNSGILYLTIEMAFSGASTWIDIGGVRLTLTHK